MAGLGNQGIRKSGNQGIANQQKQIGNRQSKIANQLAKVMVTRPLLS